MGYQDNIKRARQELWDYVMQYGAGASSYHKDALRSDLEDACKYLALTGSFRDKVEQLRELVKVAPDGLPDPEAIREILYNLPEVKP